MDKEFTWTDELVFEFTDYYEGYCKSHGITWTSVAAEEFKKSKAIPKEVPKEKDYEIISFNTGEMIWTLGDNGNYWSPYRCSNYDINTMLRDGDRIHSVKRLSDNTIWTIGDKVYWVDVFEYSHTIDKFEVDYKGYMRVTGSVPVPFDFPFTQIEKFKERNPLFTTEDGKEIFKGDAYWCVFSNFDIRTYIAVNHNLNGRWIFSNEEKAIEFVFNNKPTLSLNDLLSVWGNIDHERQSNEYYMRSELFREFKELAAKKLKQ